VSSSLQRLHRREAPLEREREWAPYLDKRLETFGYAGRADVDLAEYSLRAFWPQVCPWGFALLSLHPAGALFPLGLPLVLL
jgi:hypothetical protein